MMGHKICFYGEIWIIIPKLSLLPLLIWSTGKSSLPGNYHLEKAYRLSSTNCIFLQLVWVDSLHIPRNAFHSYRKIQ